ncbi:MAG: SRPBCC family protein [Rhizomicrobium sp.]
MTDKTEPSPHQPLKISRTFHVPRGLVFKAWSSADYIRRWFCPDDCHVPDARVDIRVGGIFEVRMCGPQGLDHRIRGTFVEVSPHDRLVLDLHVFERDERALFRALTEVDFVSVLGGTRMDVLQTYTFENPADADLFLAQAPKGWVQTLDRLERELGAIGNGNPTGRSVVHASFEIARTYDAPAERVFRAFSDEAAKSKWFSGEEGRWHLLERKTDFRVGGRERLKGRWEGGVVSTFDAVYHDIVPGERIIYTYEMHLDDRKISVSLATIQLTAEGPRRTKVTVTEQGAFLDAYDDAGSREHGTGHLLDRLGASLME